MDTHTTLLIVGILLLCGLVGVIAYWLLFRRVTPAARTRAPKQCNTCDHFDLTDGQAIMRDHPAFFEAAKHIPPRRMAQRYDDEGNVIVEEGASAISHSCAWREFGLCRLHDQLIWGRDTVGLNALHDDGPCVDWDGGRNA